MIKATDKDGISIEEEFFGKVWKWIGRDVRKFKHDKLAVVVFPIDAEGNINRDKVLADFILEYRP